MKELSSYYKMEQLKHFDREREPGQKAVKNQLKNNEEDEIIKLVKPQDLALTPFNYEPYVRKSGPFAMYYEPLLAEHLKIPNTHYIH